jgi:hypothetical protein
MPVEKCRLEPPATCPKKYKETLDEVLTLLFGGQHGGDGDDDDYYFEEDRSHRSRSSRGNPPRPNYPRANYPMANYPRANFPRANFPRANFPRANSPKAAPKSLVSKIRGFLGRACFLPCDVATTKLEEVLDKVNALDPKEYREEAATLLKRGLVMGGVGMMMYSNGELNVSKYVLTILEKLSDTIAFERILENTMGTLAWTSKASGYTARIVIGIAVAKLCLDFSLGIKGMLAKQIITIPQLLDIRNLPMITKLFEDPLGIKAAHEKRALQNAVRSANAAVGNNAPALNNAPPANNAPNAPNAPIPVAKRTRKASVKRRASSRRR